MCWPNIYDPSCTNWPQGCFKNDMLRNCIHRDSFLSGMMCMVYGLLWIETGDCYMLADVQVAIMHVVWNTTLLRCLWHSQLKHNQRPKQRSEYRSSNLYLSMYSVQPGRGIAKLIKKTPFNNNQISMRASYCCSLLRFTKMRLQRVQKVVEVERGRVLYRQERRS